MERRAFISTLSTFIAGWSFHSKRGRNAIIKPTRIGKGSTIGLVSPGSPLNDDRAFDRMMQNLTQMGYQVKVGEHSLDSTAYLAGTDEDRASDLNTMFSDPEVDAILCIRGGWGSNRILNLLDYEAIKANPKPLIGFSDITSLLLAIYHKCDLVTFHGPVGKSEWNPYTTGSWRSVLENAGTPTFNIPEDEHAYVISEGKAAGHLLGGNLSVLTSMIGSDYLPSFKGSLLFLEDVGEKVYRVDRMLTQLQLSGILDEINGVIFGKCTRCLPGDDGYTLRELLHEHFSGKKYPVFYGAMISHEEKNLTLPIGIPAQMDADSQRIQILEAAVR